MSYADDVLIDAQRRRIAQLEAANARLSGELDAEHALAETLGHTHEIASAENDRLRKRLAQYELFECVIGDPAEEFARLRRELHHLQRENAKLRKLARAYRACHDHINACRGCVELPQGCNALDMMRTLGSELGIEVDE